MIVELLSPANYISFNIKLAKNIGVLNAIYISELLNVNEKALRKGKLADNFFTIDRKYIESRTTFDVVTQKQIESQLIKIGVLTPSTGVLDTFAINFNLLASLSQCEDEDLLKYVEVPLPKQRKRSKSKDVEKKSSQVTQLKDCIDTSNDELREAYYQWIDYVCAKGTHMTDLFVKDTQKKLIEYAKGDVRIMIDVLTIGAKYAYRDLKYSIGVYESERTYKPLESPRAIPIMSTQKF